MPCQSLPSAKSGSTHTLRLRNGFLVGLARLIGTHPIQILFIHTAAQTAPLFARRTLCLKRTVITVLSTRPIAARLLRRMGPIKAQFFACWTKVDVALCFVAEAVRAEKLGPVIHIRRGNIGMRCAPVRWRRGSPLCHTCDHPSLAWATASNGSGPATGNQAWVDCPSLPRA